MPRHSIFRYGLPLAGLATFASALPTLAVMADAAGRGEAVQRAPQRVVSLNLCADQYLLALAERGQIAGLTGNADNAELSAAAGEARGLNLLGSSAEEILAIGPDLVVGMPVRGSPLWAALEEQDYPALDLGYERSYRDIVLNLRRTAAAIGQSERGEQVIADMERDLAALDRPGKGRVAAHYQRRGYLSGTGTLVDDLMKRAGLVNLAKKLDKAPLSQLSIEELVAAQPDFIIVESATDRITDQGTEMLHHPALRDIPRIRLPQAWTVCGSPSYVKAARSLAEQLKAS